VDAPGGRSVRLHFVRHGEVENPERVVYGELPGFGLSERGRVQVGLTATHIKATVGDSVRIIASPLDRAQETAAIVAEHLGEASARTAVTSDRRLTEAATGLDGQPRRFAVARYIRTWLDPATRKHKEPAAAVVGRMLSVVHEAIDAHPLSDLVFVSHQFPICMARVGLEHGLGRQESPWLAARLPSLFIRGRCGLASVSTVVIERGHVRAMRYFEPTVR
jgi:broad specificity phosphatase PhoE